MSVSIESIESDIRLAVSHIGKLSKASGKLKAKIEGHILDIYADAACWQEAKHVPFKGKRSFVANCRAELKELTELNETPFKLRWDGAYAIRRDSFLSEYVGDPVAMVKAFSQIIVSESKVGVTTQRELQTYLGIKVKTTLEDDLAAVFFRHSVETVKNAAKALTTEAFAKAMNAKASRKAEKASKASDVAAKKAA